MANISDMKFNEPACFRKPIQYILEQKNDLIYYRPPSINIQPLKEEDEKIELKEFDNKQQSVILQYPANLYNLFIQSHLKREKNEMKTIIQLLEEYIKDDTFKHLEKRIHRLIEYIYKTTQYHVKSLCDLTKQEYLDFCYHFLFEAFIGGDHILVPDEDMKGLDQDSIYEYILKVVIHGHLLFWLIHITSKTMTKYYFDIFYSEDRKKNEKLLLTTESIIQLHPNDFAWDFVVVWVKKVNNIMDLIQLQENTSLVTFLLTNKISYAQEVYDLQEVDVKMASLSLIFEKDLLISKKI